MKSDFESCTLWMERLYTREPILYTIIALVAGSVVIGIYRCFSTVVWWLPWDFFTILPSVTMGIYLSLMLIGLPNIMILMKKVFGESLPKTVESTGITKLLKSYLCNKTMYVFTILLVLLPFLLLNVTQILTGADTFYRLEHSVSALLLDFYNYIIGYFLLYLLGVLIWMVLVSCWTLRTLQSEDYRKEISVDIYAADGVGGLVSLQGYIRILLTFYFINVTLLILSYLSPTNIWSYEAIFVAILFIVGICLFFIGFGSIRQLIRGKIEDIINNLNQTIQALYEKIIELSKAESGPENEKELEWVRNLLETSYAEHDRRITLYKQVRGFDLRTIIQSGASFFIALLAYIEQVFNYVNILQSFLF